MRLWSLHPQYLDPAGLVALWREGLLAQKVLAGLTRGYTHHPQLRRFHESVRAHALIATYLKHVADEADRRGYAFDRSKIASPRTRAVVAVTRGQLQYEWQHLRAKLRSRNPKLYRATMKVVAPLPHPCFRLVEGDIAEWERT